MPPLNRDDSAPYFPPEALGPFRVLHQIGSGTLGPVFRAHDSERGRLVAIKIFQLELTPEQALALVEALDALIARGLAHPAIAAPVAAGLADQASPASPASPASMVYLAEEYAVGESLDVVLRERRSIPLAEVVPIVDRLASAIDYAARLGTHHGLLHPRDIILGADGPRVTGFGIAEAVAGLNVRLPVRRPYSAPEWLAARSSDSRAPGSGSRGDVFSLAAITWELMSGRRLAGTGPDTARPMGHLKTESGGDLSGLFTAALSVDPDARPSHARSFAVRLRHAAGLGDGEWPSDHSTPVEVESPAAFAEGFGEPRQTSTDRVLAAFADDFGEPRRSSTERVLAAFVDDFGEPRRSPTERSRETEAFERFADIGAAADLAIDAEPTVDNGFPASWTAQPPAALEPEEPPRRKWAGIFAASAVLIAGLLIGFLAGYGWRTEPVRTSGAPERPESGKPPVAATEVAVAPPGAAPPPAPPPAASAPAPAPPAPPPAISSGELLVRSTPAGAAVSINGKSSGTTPLTLTDLPLGSYTIRLTRDGYVTEERRLQLTAARANPSLTIALKPAAPPPVTAGDGSLLVESRPPGAQVFVNNRLMGKTPLSIPGVPTGPATVRLERDGYQPWIASVEVMPAARTRVAASLDIR